MLVCKVKLLCARFQYILLLEDLRTGGGDLDAETLIAGALVHPVRLTSRCQRPNASIRKGHLVDPLAYSACRSAWRLAIW
jgi:hypothetical protein